MFYTKNQRWGIGILLALILPGMLLLGPVLAGRAAVVTDSRAFSRESKAVSPQTAEAGAEQVFREEQTYTAVLPHETVYCYSDVLPEGVERVMTEGRDGELLCTALVTYVDGEESSRQRLSQRVTVNPVTEVIAVQ